MALDQSLGQFSTLYNGIIIPTFLCGLKEGLGPRPGRLEVFTHCNYGDDYHDWAYSFLLKLMKFNSKYHGPTGLFSAFFIVTRGGESWPSVG